MEWLRLGVRKIGTGVGLGIYIATEPHSYIATKHSTKGAAAGRPPLSRRPEAASLCDYVAMWLCGSVAM